MEIDVAEGTFSVRILKYSRQKKLNLIDCWETQNRDDYLRDGNNVPENQQQGRFVSVAQICPVKVSHGKVIIHRTYSTEAAEEF